MKKVLQIIFGIIILILGVLGVSYLQYRFDRSDIRHAVQAVQNARPLGADTPTVLEDIANRYQMKPENVVWDSTIQSKTQGIVQVSAQIPGESEPLLWQVDLVRFSVIPANEAAKKLGKGD